MKKVAGICLLFSLYFLAACILLPAQVPVKDKKIKAKADSLEMLIVRPPKTVVFYVDQSAVAGGTGTALKPFQKITEALLTAKTGGHAVVVKIITGTYREQLEIFNNTSLHGITRSGQPEKALGAIISGSVSNRGAYSLEINNLRIANSEAPGAIIIENSRAKTVLNNVSIDRATRYGIYQRGGTLTINTASVEFTSPGSISADKLLHNRYEAITYGTGIYLKNVVARLSGIRLRSNVQGLIAEGTGSNVDITTLKAEQHTVNAQLKELMLCNVDTIPRGYGCIQANNGSYMKLKKVELLDNDFCGLSIMDGSMVIAEDVTILRTRKVLCAGSFSRGGINASVRSGAYLELTRLELGYADLAGFQLVNARAKFSIGKVHHNLIGVHIKAPPAEFRVEDLMDRVSYENNQRNLDMETLPVPHG